MFNSAELAFRAIKRKIYSNIYDTIEQVYSDLKNYLDDKKKG